MAVTRPKSPPAWLFGITGVPYGVGGSFVGMLMPNFAEHAGISLESIGWYTTLLFVPTWLQWLYAPIIDLGWQRRYWLILVATLGAVCFGGACFVPIPEHINVFLALAFFGQLLSGLVGSCNGGLMASTMLDDARGKAGGWYNIGNLSGGALAAGAIILMTSLELPRLLIGGAIVVMMIGPSVAALAILEPPSEKSKDVFRAMLRDVRTVMTSKNGLTGFLLCLSPVGTAALANSFTGMTKPYGAKGWLVSLINGPANAILCAIGAFVGGLWCDRYNRRVNYLIAGALTAVVGVLMAISPRSVETYAIGVCAYYLVMGYCFVAFTSTVLETIGSGGKAAATKYTLYTAAGNAAISYVNFVDTRFEASHGVEGVVFADALLNIAGVVVLALVFWRLGAFGRWRHSHQLEPAEPESPKD